MMNGPDHESQKERQIVDEIFKIVLGEVDRFKRGEYATVISSLTSGRIIELAKHAKINVGQIESITGSEDYDNAEIGLRIPTYINLNDITDFQKIVFMLANDQKVHWKDKDGVRSITLADPAGLENVNLYKNPKNLYDPSIIYERDRVN